MTKTLKEKWYNDVARGIDVTMWKAMQAQQIGRKLRIEIAAAESEDEAEFFASFTAWSSHEQNYRFYICDRGKETVISVYQDDMSSKNAGKSLLIETEKPISEMERRCCYAQLRNCCDEAVQFLFEVKVWK